jgi:hypothetical protein
MEPGERAALIRNRTLVRAWLEGSEDAPGEQVVKALAALFSDHPSAANLFRETFDSLSPERRAQMLDEIDKLPPL